jgi:microcin C transport system substrate-binding protein
VGARFSLAEASVGAGFSRPDVFRKVTPMRAITQAALVAGVFSLSVACGGGGARPESEQTIPSNGGEGGAASLDKNDYPVFPNADTGADPSVPAEQGGRGFTGAGWQTNADFDLIGDPRAVKGGLFREHILDFPGTLRVLGGPESNTSLNFMIRGMVYETLLTLHPTTLEWMPMLATHWQISDDRTTYRFRIDPNARWSDGRPVVADDVVATWKFYMDKGLQDPSNLIVWGKFDTPVAESKYIVRVRTNQLNWRNFLYFAGSLHVVPAHVLTGVDGARYVKEYNFTLMPGSGPFVVNDADIVKGQSIAIRRRNDYWAATHRRNVGVNNFDEIREIVVRDENLAFEMFKRGDLDYHYVNVSRRWVEELGFPDVQRGLIQKRKIFNDNPTGTAGLAFNTRRQPWSDIRVRRALAHLLNRDLMIQKLFFNEYVPQNAYHHGVYRNPTNPTMNYDPKRALELLAEAGWKDRDAQGRLVRNGQPLMMEVLYSSKTSEPFLTIFQEDLRRVGVGLNLRMVTGETLFQLVMQRRFDVVSMGWGGLLFPNPETMWHSQLADVENNNNLTGFKDKRVDELLVAYDREFDQAKRVEIIREVDGILANAHHYILQWDAPFQRIAFWNKFGYPESHLTRHGDYTEIPSLWWRDPQKEAQLAQARRDGSVKLAVGPTDVRYWQEYAKREGEAVPPASTSTR